MADFTAQFQNPRRLELLNTLSDLIGDMLRAVSYSWYGPAYGQVTLSAWSNSPVVLRAQEDPNMVIHSLEGDHIEAKAAVDITALYYLTDPLHSQCASLWSFIFLPKWASISSIFVRNSGPDKRHWDPWPTGRQFVPFWLLDSWPIFTLPYGLLSGWLSSEYLVYYMAQGIRETTVSLNLAIYGDYS